MLFIFFSCAAALPSWGISPSIKEIEGLFNQGKYSLVLEKSLDILNTGEGRLSPAEAAFLHYYAGLAYKKNHNREMAADYFKNLTVKFPDSVYLKAAYRELADLYKDDYLLQETYLAKLFESFPGSPEAVQAGLDLCQNYLRLKNYKKALPVMDTMVNSWNQGEALPGLYMLMAEAYSGMENYPLAFRYLDRAEKTINTAILSNPAYLLTAGKIYYRNLKFRDAIKNLELLFNVFPNYPGIPGAAILLSQCHEREGRPFLGAVFLVKAIEKRPGREHIYTLFLNLARLLQKLDDNDLKKIRQNYPLYSDANKLLVSVENNSLDFTQRQTAAILLGDDFKKKGDLKQSVDNYYRYLLDNRDPLVENLFRQDLDFYLDDLVKKENYREIFKLWVKLKNRKSFVPAPILLRFGEILWQMKLAANAEEIYRHLLEYKMYAEHWPAAGIRLIRIYFRMGRYKDCLGYLEKAGLYEEPDPGEIPYYRVICCQRLKKEREAENLLVSDAVHFEEITGIFQFRISQLRAQQLEKEKNYDGALAVYERMALFSQVPREDEIRLMISIAGLHYRLKDLGASLECYRKAAALEPASPPGPGSPGFPPPGPGYTESFSFPGTGTPQDIDREWILFQVACISIQLDRTSEAEKELEKLKRLNPGSFWVRQLEKTIIAK